MIKAGCWLLVLMLGNAIPPGQAVAAEKHPPGYTRKSTWQETLLAARMALRTASSPDEPTDKQVLALYRQVEDDFPVQWDWTLQDYGQEFAAWFKHSEDTSIEQQLIVRALESLDQRAENLWGEFEQLRQSGADGDDPLWLNLYVQACEQRRAARLRTLHAQSPSIVYTRRRTVIPSFFAYTEGQSDAQSERHFLPGAALCRLDLTDLYGRTKILLEDPEGVIRDPAVSYDGQRILFAWKKSLDEDDYHLYEMEAASGQVRQLTFGLGFADYEGCYLPDDNIVFASTRCVQTVDCWWTEVSNLYLCGPDGRHLRRLSFDQVHAIYPTVMDDGRIIYTRWDYNDRGQVFPQALFQMHFDGSGQTEFYGNNSWFPTTIAHARGIPGSSKVVAIFMGHHTPQTGKLGLLDPAQGRQENSGARLIAPVRETPAERIDSYGQEGELFQYPYPLNDAEFIVAYAPLGWQHERGRPEAARFSLYWMGLDGQRELLVSDARAACTQPVPLAARNKPLQRPSVVDYRSNTGTYYVQDIYAGPGLAGIERGAIKHLRVVALDYRAAGVGENGSSGPGGAALISTPIAIGNGSWDVKVILGQAEVQADGSAFFTVPARTPVYFQAMDDQGQAVQTMRSWSTLQPGENQSCVGCHESKNSTPLAVNPGFTLAMKAGPQELEPFYGPPRGFSFPKEIQPILDRHCTACHKDRQAAQEMVQKGRSTISPRADSEGKPVVFSLLGVTISDPIAKRQWNDAYLVLTQAKPEVTDSVPARYYGNVKGRWVNWISSQSVPTPIPPYFAGAAKSPLIALLAKGHHQVRLSQEELDKIKCWIDLLVPFCGDYTEANAWSSEETAKYQHFVDKRRRMQALEQRNIASLMAP